MFHRHSINIPITLGTVNFLYNHELHFNLIFDRDDWIGYFIHIQGTHNYNEVELNEF